MAPMKIVSILFFVFMALKCEALTYCVPSPVNGLNDYTTSNISLGSLNASGGLSSTYDYFPDTNINRTCFLRPGQTYSLTIISNSVHSSSTYAGWIDWNNDTTLSSSEKLGEFTTNSAGQSGAFTFTVPLSSVTGKLRLRVRCSSSSSINSCANYTYGQTSDFTITVLNNAVEYNFFAGWETASNAGNYINGVLIENATNQNTGNLNGTVYSDFSRIISDVECCEPETITIQTVAPNSGFNRSDVYVDLNQDGFFAQSELVLSLTAGIGTQTTGGSFSLPALTGERILRIYFYTNAGLSEVEDYTISLIPSSLSSRPEAKIGSGLFTDCSNGCAFIGCEGINSFTDLSCGVPTNWEWKVPGASPSQSTLQNPSFSFTPGLYTVTLIASNASGSDTDVVTINVKRPFANFNLGNDTSLCSGNSIDLNAPDSISPNDCLLYHWSNGAIGNSISVTVPGTYWVRIDTCTHSLCPGIDTILVSFSPLVYSVTGGGYYCSGTSAPSVGLSDSQSGVSYQLLFNGAASGTPIPGTGNAISFGVQNQSGTYTVQATNVSTSCTSLMSGNVQVTLNPIPQLFVTSGGGSFCSGTGAPVSLSGSENGISYQLSRNGTTTGSPVIGNGAVISFPLQYPSGTYTVIATNPNTGCTRTMNGSAIVVRLPTAQQHTIIGGGIFCSGSANASVGISGSDSGAVYLLYMDSIPTGDTIIGTGAAIEFTHLTQSGEYTIVGTMNGQCTTTMIGSAILNLKASPALFNVTGGGTYCYMGNLVDIGVDSSQLLVNYRLWKAGIPYGGIVQGNGSALHIASVLTPGTYNVIATNTANACTLSMNGVATIVLDSFPHFYNVTGGGSFCEGDSGVAIGLDSSSVGVQYSLHWNADSTGYSIPGTGGMINFGLVDSAGWYSVWATSQYGCYAQMSGSATIYVNPLPVCSIVPQAGPVCIFQSPFLLSGIPSGGVFSGTGITNDSLFPSVAGLGIAIIRYDYTDSFGCTSTAYDSIEIDICNKIDENSGGSLFNLYPNPANGVVRIEFTNSIQSGSIKLYNAVGSVVSNMNFSNERICSLNTDQLTEGVYFMRMEINNSLYERRVTIIH